MIGHRLGMCCVCWVCLMVRLEALEAVNLNLRNLLLLISLWRLWHRVCFLTSYPYPIYNFCIYFCLMFCESERVESVPVHSGLGLEVVQFRFWIEGEPVFLVASNA